MAELLRPARGGFIRPFGCGWFIREFLSGRGPNGSPRVDPSVGAPQAEVFYYYKHSLIRAIAVDRATRQEEREARRVAQNYLEGKRDSHAETWIKHFVDAICKEQHVEPPEVIVVEDTTLLEFADANKARYRYPEETLYVGAEWPALVPVSRELYRHIQWKKHGDAVLKELNECLKQGTSQDQCPTEIARDQWIKDNADKFYDLWFKAEHEYPPHGAGTLRTKKTKP